MDAGGCITRFGAEGGYLRCSRDRVSAEDRSVPLYRFLLDFTIEVIKWSDDQKGFKVLPRRGVVERSFSWMTRWRRLVRDYEKRIDVSKAMILVTMGGNMLRRNAHPWFSKQTLRRSLATSALTNAFEHPAKRVSTHIA